MLISTLKHLSLSSDRDQSSTLNHKRDAVTGGRSESVTKSRTVHQNQRDVPQPWRERAIGSNEVQRLRTHSGAAVAALTVGSPATGVLAPTIPAPRTRNDLRRTKRGSVRNQSERGWRQPSAISRGRRRSSGKIWWSMSESAVGRTVTESPHSTFRSNVPPDASTILFSATRSRCGPTALSRTRPGTDKGGKSPTWEAPVPPDRNDLGTKATSPGRSTSKRTAWSIRTSPPRTSGPR